MSKVKEHFAKRVRVALAPKEDKKKNARITILGTLRINKDEFVKTDAEKLKLKEMKANCENKVLSSDINRRRRGHIAA